MRIGKQELIELPEYLQKNISRSAISEDVGEIIFRQYKNQVDIEFPSPKTEWLWRLKSQGWVGYIPVTSELGLYLSPKVPLKNLFGMLEYAYRLKSLRFMDGMTSCSSLEEFYEQIAKLLAKCVLDRGRKGFYRGYYPKNEQLPYICGRLDIQKAIRQPWSINLECHYEEFTSDVEDNQILAWTLNKILLTSMCTEKSLPVIRLAYRTVQGFASLKPFGPKACIKRFYNRLNQDYTGMHALCRFFLENSGPKHEIGNHTMIPFLVNMERLFELFMAEWLRKHLPPQFSIKSQEVISLDQEGTINFKIDLVLYDERNKTPLCVLDTKYKGSDSRSDNDIIQVVLYAMAKKCSLALLIYPTPLITPIDTIVRDIGRDIRVKNLTFALDGDLEHAGTEFIKKLLAQPEIQGASIEGSLDA
jgi:5-methylcytosine-specific restriction enzyme subunit McrC